MRVKFKACKKAKWDKKRAFRVEYRFKNRRSNTNTKATANAVSIGELGINCDNVLPRF